MVWDYATNLRNAEFSVRWNPCCQVTMLAGFRWVNLGEHLVGTLNPTTFPWEQSYWNFWNNTTTNNLYGFQIGADGKIWERGRFSIGGLVKAGIFDNNAEQTTEISVMAKQQRSGSASTNAVAFVGETGLQCNFQVTQRLLLRAGYEAIWLQGVAVAPDRFRKRLPIWKKLLRKPWASIATPACSITAPPPAWSIRFRNCNPAFCSAGPVSLFRPKCRHDRQKCQA